MVVGMTKIIGVGKNLRKVIMDVRPHGTWTTVLDSEGNTLVNRFKSIERNAIGDRKINRITKVYEDRKGMSSMNVTDRVYDASGNYLGYKQQFLDRDDLFDRLILKNGKTYYKQAGLKFTHHYFPLNISGEIKPIENTISSFVKLPQIKPLPYDKEIDELNKLLDIWS